MWEGSPGAHANVILIDHQKSLLNYLSLRVKQTEETTFQELPVDIKWFCKLKKLFSRYLHFNIYSSHTFCLHLIIKKNDPDSYGGLCNVGYIICILSYYKSNTISKKLLPT